MPVCTLYIEHTQILSTSMRTRVAQQVRYLDYLTTHTSLSPIRRKFAPGFVNYKNGCTRLAASSDKVYKLLAHGRWFSQSTPASPTTKTGRNDIAEILLKVASKHQKSIKINLPVCLTLHVSLIHVIILFSTRQLVLYTTCRHPLCAEYIYIILNPLL